MAEEQNNQTPDTQPVQPVQPVQPEPPIQATVTDAPVAPPAPQGSYATANQAAPDTVPPAPAQGAPMSYSAAAKPEGDGKGTTSLVLGILSIVFCGPILGLVLGIIAVVFGRQSKKMLPAGYPSGKATGGVVTGVIGIVLSVLSTIALVATLVAGVAIMGSDEFQDALRDSSISSYTASTEADNKAVEQAGTAALDKACKLDAADSAALAKDIDADFESMLGCPASDFGITSEELATWVTSGATYDIDDAQALGDQGYVSATAQSRSLLDLLDACEDEYMASGATIDSSTFATDPAAKTQMGTMLRAAMDKTPPSEKYLFVTVTKAGDSWLVSEADQADLLSQLYTF